MLAARVFLRVLGYFLRLKVERFVPPLVEIVVCGREVAEQLTLAMDCPRL